jgi:hypothetical protein
VRSNTFVERPWQLREFKTNINTKGEAVFVADSVKSNPLAELFAKQGVYCNLTNLMLPVCC